MSSCAGTKPTPQLIRQGSPSCERACPKIPLLKFSKVDLKSGATDKEQIAKLMKVIKKMNDNHAIAMRAYATCKTRHKCMVDLAKAGR